MNPYEAPQTVALTPRKKWPQVPQHWCEKLLCAAIGSGIGLVENYFRYQARQLQRTEMRQQAQKLLQSRNLNAAPSSP